MNNIFLFKYGLSKAIPAKFKNYDVDFNPTAMPDDPQKFFSSIPAAERESYAKYGEEVIRIELVEKQTKTKKIFYLFFRNKIKHNPDGSRSFNTPSSFELGFTENGDFMPILKTHYNDVYGDDETQMKTMTSAIIAAIADKVC